MKKFFTRKTTAIICCVAILFTCFLPTGLFTLADSTAKTDDPNAKPEGSVIRVDVGGGVIYKRLTTIMDETDIPDGAYLEYDVFFLDNANIGLVDFGKDNVGWTRDHTNSLDQNGYRAHPSIDYSAEAFGRWYHRKVNLNDGFSGKEFTLLLASESGAAGSMLLDNICITANGAVLDTASENPTDWVLSNYAGSASMEVSLVSLDDANLKAEISAARQAAGVSEPSEPEVRYDDPNAKPEGSVIRVDVGGGVIYKRLTTIMDDTDIPDGAYLEYDVFLLNDANIGIVDFGKDNVGWARDHANISFDQNGYRAHPSVDYTDEAYGRWYHRKVTLNDGFSGKEFTLLIASESSAAGSMLIDNICITANGVVLDTASEKPADWDLSNFAGGASMAVSLVSLDDANLKAEMAAAMRDAGVADIFPEIDDDADDSAYDNYKDSLIEVESWWDGYDSIANRPTTGNENTGIKPAYNYSVDLVVLEDGTYRCYAGGRWLHDGGDGDHILLYTSPNGTGYSYNFDGVMLHPGADEGVKDAWYSNNQLEPEVLKIGNTWYMYAQCAISKNGGATILDDANGTGALPAEYDNDRILLLTSTDGKTWTRNNTKRGVIVNLYDDEGKDIQQNIGFTHQEVIYVEDDPDGKPFWMYVFVKNYGGYVRLRSADPTTFDWTQRETTSGMSDLGNKVAYLNNMSNGEKMFVRISLVRTNGRIIPALAFSTDGLRFNSYEYLLEGSDHDSTYRNTYFLGLSTLNGTGEIPYNAQTGEYEFTYGACTCANSVAPEIFFSCLGGGHGTIKVTEKPNKESNSFALTGLTTAYADNIAPVGVPVQMLAQVSNPEEHQVSYEWSVNDENQATIDQNGLLTPKKAGQVIVTVKANGKAKMCSVWFEELQSVSIPVEQSGLITASSTDLTLQVVFPSGTYTYYKDSAVEWTVVSGTDLGSFGKNGELVTAMKRGDITVRATLKNAPQITAELTLPVNIAFLKLYPEGADSVAQIQGYMRPVFISELITLSGFGDDVTSLVDTNTIDGSKDYNSAEIKKALFDNNSKTKFLTNENVPSKEEPIWISFALSEAKAISSYKIVSANDASGRDPSSWVFYGSKDGQTWVALDTRNGVLFTDRYQDQAFSFNNEEEYTYYKLAITANKDSGQMTQFADFFVGVSNDNQLQGVKNYDVVWSSVDGKVSFADMTTEDMDRSMTAMRLTFLDSGKTTIRVTLKEDTSIYAEYTLDVLADSTDLESLLSDAEGVEKDKYTAESYEALQSAIAAAKKVLDDEDALQSEINAVAEALELAMDALEEVADNNGATDEGDDKDNGDDKDTPGSVDTGDVYPYFAIALLLVSLTALLITKVRRKAE